MTQSHQPRSARGPPLSPAYLATFHPLAYPHPFSFRVDFSIKLLPIPRYLHTKKEKVLAFSSFLVASHYLILSKFTLDSNRNS